VNKKTLLLFSITSIALTLLAIPLLDRPVAELMRNSGFENAWLFSRGTTVLDYLTGKEVSKFLLGGALLIGGLAIIIPARTKPLGSALLFIGLVQLFSTLLSGMSKNLFGRLRPFQLLETGAWNEAWFVDGSSFPSGHAGFYFGLFLPLAYLLPRWRWPLLVVPFFIAIARVNANDHFVSDATASMALAALITLLAIKVMRNRLPSPLKASPASPAT